MAKRPRQFQAVATQQVNPMTQELSQRAQGLMQSAWARPTNYGPAPSDTPNPEAEARMGPDDGNRGAGGINWNQAGSGDPASYLRYTNQNATRNKPLSDNLAQALSFLGKMGITGEVYSGGQPGKGSGEPRVGSVRHDHGESADMLFYKDGRKLDWANQNDLPYFQQIVRQGMAAGLTGFGAGDGYMQPGSMHIGYGKPAIWGAGGSGKNAAPWLRDIYYG